MNSLAFASSGRFLLAGVGQVSIIIFYLVQVNIVFECRGMGTKTKI